MQSVSYLTRLIWTCSAINNSSYPHVFVPILNKILHFELDGPKYIKYVLLQFFFINLREFILFIFSFVSLNWWNISTLSTTPQRHLSALIHRYKEATTLERSQCLYRKWFRLSKKSSSWCLHVFSDVEPLTFYLYVPSDTFEIHLVNSMVTDMSPTLSEVISLYPVRIR